MRLIATSCLLLLLSIRTVLACEMALVVALDVSRSVDRDEYKLMRAGIVSAFLDEDVVQQIGWMQGGLMVTVTQWGGVGQQRQAMAWQRLSSPRSILRFATELGTIDRGFWMADTSVSEALSHADAMFADVGTNCRRRVIDVSGDGVSNAGPDALPVARRVGASGITVNGLIITGASPDPVSYFLSQIIGGPGAFVETANSYEDYPRAMKRKLLREFAPVISALPPGSSGQQAPYQIR